MTTTDTDLFTEITNDCICADDEGDPSDECFGCWDDELAYFEEQTQALRDKSDYGWWRVEGLPLWDGAVSGIGHAKNAEELLGLMTVRGDWKLGYRVTDTEIIGRLGHHDGSGVLTARPLEGDF